MIRFAAFLLNYAPGLISATTVHGHLPVHIACKNWQDLSVIKFLYNSYPSAINSKDSDGNTPLCTACSVGSGLTVLEFLFNAYPETMYTKNNDGHTLLGVAQGPDYIHGEAEAGQDRLPDENGQLPIHCSIQNQLLVSANPESLLHADSNGNLPLHIACGEGICSIAVILERADDGLSVENNEGKTHIDMLLYDAKCDWNSLEYVQAANAFIRANPASVVHLLVCNIQSGRKSGPNTLKRKCPS
jgi:hypothetical protein